MNQRRAILKPCEAPGTASVEEGVILLDGPDGVAVAMTPEAAEMTAGSLLEAVALARQGSTHDAALPHPDGAGMAGQEVAILVAPGVDGDFVLLAQAALQACGVACRIVAPGLGVLATANGGALTATVSLDTAQGLQFDAIILAAGQEAVAALSEDLRTLDFIRDQVRHGKTFLAIGEARRLLTLAGSLPEGAIVADANEPTRAIAAFIRALGGQTRHEAGSL